MLIAGTHPCILVNRMPRITLMPLKDTTIPGYYKGKTHRQHLALSDSIILQNYLYSRIMIVKTNPKSPDNSTLMGLSIGTKIKGKIRSPSPFSSAVQFSETPIWQCKLYKNPNFQ